MLDGDIAFAAQEERFTRKKHDSGFPANALLAALNKFSLGIEDVDYFVFYDKPLLKFERLLETYYAFAPKGLSSFIKAMPLWTKEKLFMRRTLVKEITALSGINGRRLEKTVEKKLLFSDHHLSHAASAFFPSPFDRAAILTIDGVGEWTTASIGCGEGNSIKILKVLDFPHSLGLLYSAFTYYLGFKVNSGEYKMMGLAPYGRPDSKETREYFRAVMDELLQMRDDGSIWLNKEYFEFPVGLKMTNDYRFERLFKIKKRNPESPLSQEHMDLALAIQKVTEEAVVRMSAHAKELSNSNNLVYAGGVALNCVANSKILEQGIFEKLWIQPAAGDAGGALGAALAAWYILLKNERIASSGDSMRGSYLGPIFDEDSIRGEAIKNHAPFKKFKDFKLLAAEVAGILAKGNVVGWYQGRMEFGPRALGNRSILADARNEDMQKKMNIKIKFRESFRPFAPAVLLEDTGKYFESSLSSPYMLLIDKVTNSRRNPLPDGYHEWALEKKLYFIRSDIPAVTHIDFSARLQTVDGIANPRFYELIKEFKNITGCSVLVNTSFNVRGEPIVCTPEDAYRCFMRTEMDYLVMGDFLFDKSRQPKWHDVGDWKKEYEMD